MYVLFPQENSSPTVESSPEVTDEKEESPSATLKVEHLTYEVEHACL